MQPRNVRHPLASLTDLPRKLNVMANSGYISRTGITSSQELAWAMQESLSIGPDLAEFLGVSLNLARISSVKD